MSVYKNKSGYYEIDFQYKGRRLHKCTEATTEKAALAIEKQLREQAKKDREHEELTGSAPLTINQLCFRYWEKAKDKPSAADIHRAFTFIIDTLGKDMRIDKITDAHVIKLIEKRRKLPRWGRKGSAPSNATINRDVTEVLKRLLKYAKSTWKCQLPIEPDWGAHMLKEPQERVRELDENEAAALDEAVRDDYEPWFRFSRLTGLRRAETLIEWSNVNRAAGLITIKGKGDRLVRTPITPAVAEILDQCEGHHQTAVFTYVAQRTANGKVKGQRYPITYEGCKVAWRRQRERAGVENCRFHDLRHDLASKLLRSSGNLPLVKETLNHSSITMTARYAHVSNSDVKKALTDLQASFGKSPKKSPKTSDQAA